MKNFFKITGIIIIGFVILSGIILLCLYLLSPKQATTSKKIKNRGKIDNYFKKITLEQTPPAITITVLKKGKTVYSKAFGYADRPNKIPVKTNTIYPWWSVTKLFTATAIMQLYEQGKLSLNDPIQKYIPDFEVKDKKGIKKNITIHQLLVHTSGLKDFMPDGMFWIRLAEKPKPNQSDFLREKITGKFRVLKSEPGIKASYTNIGYIALGVVIESITGMEYEEYILKNILIPLDMNNTSFIRNKEQQSNTAIGSNPVINIFTGLLWVFGDKNLFKTYVRDVQNGHIWFNPLYTDYTPSSGLSGTSLEMARFGQVFLQKGIYNEHYILNQNTISMMLKPYSLNDLGKSYNDENYGLGWKVWKVNNQIVYGHGGEGPGFGALLAIIPERELVIAINANDTNIKRDELLRMLTSIAWE